MQRATQGIYAVRPEVPLLAAMISVQFGSAFARTIFHEAGPAGVAALRVAFTALVLLAISRPSFAELRGRSRADLVVVSSYGILLATLNWTFYEALQRLPLGVAVTIEFTGPLAVAVVGSRRWLDAVWVVLAATGVALLALRGGTGGVHGLGVLLALTAAAMWAGYILLAKRVTRAFDPMQALAIGMAVGTVVVLPAGITESGARLLHPGILAGCFAVAMLSSLIPYTLELVALRRLSTAVFGLLMSVEPAVAALAGVIVLGQPVTLVLGVALVLVVTASVGTTLVAARAVRVATPSEPTAVAGT